MHTSHLLWAGALLAALGWLASSSDHPTDDAGLTAPVSTLPPKPPAANGHLVLVVEGDRDQLRITHATSKVDPWAGVAKGARSAWTLEIRGTDGMQLAEIPLDVAPFDVSPERKGGPIQLDGCIVRDPRIAMLVSVPDFAEAASYTFTRTDEGRTTLLGTVTGAHVHELVRGGR